MQCITTKKQSNQIRSLLPDYETNNMAHDSQIVRANENLKISCAAPSR